MQMFRKKWLTHVMLLFVVLALAVSFTAVAQAGGGEEEPAPAEAEESPTMGKPPMGKPPMGKPVKPIPELANCIGVTALYDGSNTAMDGASIVLMKEAAPPPEDPPIGPDGEEIVKEMPEMDGKPMMGPPPMMGKPPMMEPPPGAEKPMGPPVGQPQKPEGPPKKPQGPPMKPPSAPEKPMGPPKGKMAEKPMPVKPTPQYVVLDRKITRDGGTAAFCDLKPGTYIVQGDAVEGITGGDNRAYVKLVEDDFQEVVFGFSYVNGGPETTNGNGA